jgi:molecular chaperone DnaK
MIPAGAELICEYEIRDSGNLILDVTVPAASFSSSRNFYSRQEGQLDFHDVTALLDEQRQHIASRIEALSATISDRELAPVRKRLEAAQKISSQDPDAESAELAKQAAEYLQDAKRLLAQTRTRNLSSIREIELEGLSNLFNDHARQFASPNEITAFDNLARTAERAIAKTNSSEFEILADDMRARTFAVLWRQDDFVRDRFRWFDSAPFLFVDPAQRDALRARGEDALARNDMSELRRVVLELDNIRFGPSDESELSFATNIVRG